MGQPCINSQLNLTAFGVSVSAEEISGNIAIDLAMRALTQNEIDCALVGAVAIRQDQLESQTKDHDAVAVLILKRLEDAQQAGEHIYGIMRFPRLESPASKDVAEQVQERVQMCLGHTQEAHGALLCAALVLGADGAMPEFPQEGVLLEVRGMVESSHTLEFHPFRGVNADRHARGNRSSSTKSMVFPLRMQPLSKIVESIPSDSGTVRQLNPPPPMAWVIPKRQNLHKDSACPDSEASKNTVYHAMVDVHCEFLEHYLKAHLAYMDLLHRTQDVALGDSDLPVVVPDVKVVPPVYAKKVHGHFEPAIWREPRAVPSKFSL